MSALRKRLKSILSCGNSVSSEPFLKESGYYCDTEIMGLNTHTIEADIEFPDETVGDVWGVTSPSGRNGSHILRKNKSNSILKLFARMDTSSIESTFTPETNVRYHTKVYPSAERDRVYLEINNVVQNFTTIGDVAGWTYYLGALRHSYNIRNANCCFKIYRFKITSIDGEVLCDYVPKKVNGNIILYDRITSKEVIFKSV